MCSAVCKFFLERERNKERASAAVLAWLQCVGGSVRLWVFAARMAAQSSTEDVLMESAGTPTELPSPTPSEKAEAYMPVESAAEAWPATAAAAVLAVDFPDLEFTTHDQQAHEANTKLASELKASIENKLSEIGIMNFWNTPNLANDSARTQWQYMMKLPALSIAVASKQCKQGWMRWRSQRVCRIGARTLMQRKRARTPSARLQRSFQRRCS